MKLVLLFFISLTVWHIAAAQSLDGKWRWGIHGSSIDMQSDYTLEMDLKQVGSKVYGTRTLFLENYPNVIIWVEGTIDKNGTVLLQSGKPIQYKVPDSFFVAKNFKYNFKWNEAAHQLSGMYYPSEDSNRMSDKAFQNPSVYDAIYKKSYNVYYTRVTEKLDSTFTKILNDKVKLPVAPPEPVIKTDIKHILTIPYGDMKIELYDNGTVDGDIITLLINGKVMSQHQKLSLAPITINIKKEDLQDSTLVVMQAENLGDIPPNTALMLIYVNGNRYDVNMSSTLEKQDGLMLYIKKPKK